MSNSEFKKQFLQALNEDPLFRNDVAEIMFKQLQFNVICHNNFPSSELELESDETPITGFSLQNLSSKEKIEAHKSNFEEHIKNQFNSFWGQNFFDSEKCLHLFKNIVFRNTICDDHLEYFEQLNLEIKILRKQVENMQSENEGMSIYEALYKIHS